MTNCKKFDIMKGFYQIFLKKFAFYQKFCYNERIKASAALNFGKIFIKNLLRGLGGGILDEEMHHMADSKAYQDEIRKIYAVRTIREGTDCEERRTWSGPTPFQHFRTNIQRFRTNS